ncbi:carboxyl-terminal protease [Planctopirus limnophila DSM 3776]|uniref:Carboxyl-terminal protease n=1 Tax=Planctopirus limnophila (strain ATCC 43296 / DSM 3776 / IFAM 1008 / Mu 290) TaxID=521674 RepID=D5SU02_PLAL2|nr:carboxy terminal-processing peptidase [Planctopirus limnophila]ADG66987.1 carboxyl-terminal protease [Planctopirus limnophila DSM 3776]
MIQRLPSRAVAGLVACLCFMAASTIFAQNLGKTSSSEQTTARLAADMISKYHIGQKPVDDRISQLTFTRYLKDLDPAKLYFTKADIDEFSPYKDKLDDLLKAGNVEFSHLVFQRYLQRLTERVAIAHQLIDLPHDFTVDESMVTDGDLLAYAATPEELNERWRKRIKFELVSLLLDDKTIEEARKQVHKRYDTLLKAAKGTEPSEILEIYLSAVAHSFDPHSSYMSPQTVEDFQISMRLSLEGIGAALRSIDGYVTVSEVVPGGAAEKDGRLKANDKIVAVAQDGEDYVDVVEMKLNRVVRLIRGMGGTKVKLKVVNAANETSEVVLTRQKIELKAQEVKGEIIPLETRIPGAKGRIGVINIPSFYRDFGGAQAGQDNFKSTSRDVAKALQEFDKQGGVDAVVIDLRMNGGGALTEAIEVSGLFIDQGPVVQIKEPNGKIKSYDDEDPGVMYKGPLVVLCNRLSASASEIFAAAIKDYGRGIVVGDTTTHGKGTVQHVMPISNRMFSVLNNQDLGSVKLTINQFYRVNGDSTQNRGVPSDVVLPSLVDHMDLGESFLENALAFDQVPKAAHPIYDMTPANVLAALKEQSARRIAAEADFDKIRNDVTRFDARKNRKTISLNQETLKKERDEEKAVEEIRKEEEEHETKGTNGPIFKKTPYNDEVLKIASEYVTLLRQAKTAKR